MVSIHDTERLRAELAAEKQANKELQLVLESHLRNENAEELATLKALLREADSYLLSNIFIWEDGDEFDQLHKRILAALGDEPK